ncbi:DUF4198 domain-containing protein [Stenotrophomonas koreensis]|uniref:DUF4198 domain-containing protein n=1 Tax=Stenotrophomonas koreensis TaxID=266128 RepID=UPI00339AC2E4
MKRPLALATLLAALLPLSANAHKQWLQPSATVVAGAAPWISVDAAVSNNLFYFDHVAMRTENIVVTAPDGSNVAIANAHTGKLRSVFDIELNKPGTWRVASVNAGLMATWTEDGKPRRWRGNAETFAREVDTSKADLRVSETVGRVETFITNGNPNDTALALTGKGIELQAVDGHFNDLFAGETSTFQVFIDGTPAAGLEFEIIRGDTRYRNAQEEITATSDANGQINVTWPSAGMYWLETTSSDARTSVPQAAQRRLSYVATLEVLPQ